MNCKDNCLHYEVCAQFSKADGANHEYCVQGPCPNFKTVEQIKVEAYKEFAEKLKDAAMSYLRGGKYYKIITTRCIDTLLKEMVGEEE